MVALWWYVGGLGGMKHTRALGHASKSEGGMTNPGRWYDHARASAYAGHAAILYPMCISMFFLVLVGFTRALGRLHIWS